MNLRSVPAAALVALRLWLVGGSLRTLSTWRNLRARGNRVKFHLGLSLFVLDASGMTYAAEGKELLAQLSARMAQASSPDVVVGQIAGQRYVALRFDAGESSQERFEPVLLIARATEAGYVYVAHFKLTNLNDFAVRFGDSSIYLSQESAHHGVYFQRYQFRLRDGHFRLIGVEEQSQTLPVSRRSGSSVALWETRSANLLTQTAVYRAQVSDLADEAVQKEASQRFAAKLPPLAGKVRSVPLRARPNAQWDLARFDPYLFRTDFLCHYFDTELVFRSGCKQATVEAGK